VSSQDVEILLVEDNPADVELTLRSLKVNRIADHITVARDGEEALDFLFCRGVFSGRSGQLPKLILLDLKLPKVSGMEVLRQLKANPATAAVPVVILTSSREARDVANGYQLGANSFIQKPVDFTKLMDTVKQVGLYWLVVNEPPPASHAEQK